MTTMMVILLKPYVIPLRRSSTIQLEQHLFFAEEGTPKKIDKAEHIQSAFLTP